MFSHHILCNEHNKFLMNSLSYKFQYHNKDPSLSKSILNLLTSLFVSLARSIKTAAYTNVKIQRKNRNEDCIQNSAYYSLTSFHQKIQAFHHLLNVIEQYSNPFQIGKIVANRVDEPPSNKQHDSRTTSCISYLYVVYIIE